jgi:hypothetical protein
MQGIIQRALLSCLVTLPQVPGELRQQLAAALKESNIPVPERYSSAFIN